MKLSWVLPVHNNEAIVEPNVELLAERLASLSTRVEAPEIVLVENGSRDASWPAAQAAAGARHGARVFAFREANAGLGYAYARGVRELLERHGPDPSRYVVLTATDLPFAFTDLDGALPLLEKSIRGVAGSKAHRESRAWAGRQRYVMSIAYRTVRRALLGMKIGDSQGSFFLRLDLLAVVAPQVTSRDFFYTTELAYFIERNGERVAEVPVVLEAHQLVAANSSVRPFRNAARMLAQMVALRARR